jgi:ABC-type nickel/cobalt efflux system permease component RcnA
MNKLLVALCSFVIGLSSTAHAHPVPRRSHDRTIQVRLTADPPTGQVVVVVDYRLEVDEWTVVYVDLPAFSDQVDLTRLAKPRDFYEAFTRCYAPILADNLLATVDQKPLSFTCVRHGHEVLDHLRCDFVFQASLKVRPGQAHEFTFREGNYELEAGMIRLSLASESPVRILRQTGPDEALKALPAIELKPGDDARLRQATATFEVPAVLPDSPGAGSLPRPEPPAEPAAPAREPSLLTLLLDSDQGIWVLLYLAAFFGAVHALTPGHGKTLVAAYLVGERGTVWHALVLGLVTTLTHTGAVLALAAGLLIFSPNIVPETVQTTLGLGGGLLVAGMGFWLLLRRLSGRADHVHLGGGHGHHHHHGPGGHHHHHLDPDKVPVGWWGLIILGMSGGIVPCWDALIMFGFAVSAQRLWLGLPLLLAFSAGLASVLIVIGILVVHVKGFASSRMGESRLIRALPLISAVLVTGLGLWLCYESVHPAAGPPGPLGGP